jgi:acyl-coenzyme A synthetase/AMP-(fatty) acid ligase
MIGLDRLCAPSIVATVPSNHMYGLELTVLQVLQAGASVHVERPAYPADIARCLRETPSPRVLVTTPFHLRGLMESDIALPPVARVISATAPMSAAFALSAERRIDAPVHEIYGFTEIGSVATREPARQSDWTMRDDLIAVFDGDIAVVTWRSFEGRTPFPDVVEVVDERRIRLLGRSRDMVKVAGKRASLPGLSAELTRIPGVEDGVLLLMAEDEGRGLVSRLAAFVVAPGLSAVQIRHELRRFIDPAFMPRYVFHVSSLPRNETGKLRQDDLQKLAAEKLFRDELP